MALILIVDDLYRDRGMVTKMLASEGHQTICVTNAAAALACIERAKPDLAVLNGLAEGFDSFRLLSEIKNERPHFPVLRYVMRARDALEKLKQVVAFSLSVIRFYSRKQILFQRGLQEAIGAGDGCQAEKEAGIACAAAPDCARTFSMPALLFTGRVSSIGHSPSPGK